MRVIGQGYSGLQEQMHSQQWIALFSREYAKGRVKKGTGLREIYMARGVSSATRGFGSERSQAEALRLTMASASRSYGGVKSATKFHGHTEKTHSSHTMA